MHHDTRQKQGIFKNFIECSEILLWNAPKNKRMHCSINVVVACILWRWIALFAKKCVEWNFYIFVEMRDSMWHAIEFKHSSTITVIMFCINIYIYLIRMSNEKKRNASVRCCIYRYRNRWFALNKIEFPIVCFFTHVSARSRASHWIGQMIAGAHTLFLLTITKKKIE